MATPKASAPAAVGGTTQPGTLDKERANASFNPRQLTYLLFGGKERTERVEQIASMVEKEPVFSRRNKYFTSGRKEYFKMCLEKAKVAHKMITELGLSAEESSIFRRYVDEEPAISTHYSMFIPSLQNLASDEQRNKWLPLAENLQIIGSYAQTELGHGSNVRGLETVSTYDKNTREFVIHSPTLTSMKWWPGGLGKVSTHALVHARLILDGKDHGIHTFLVQLRSLEDHRPLPGITVGDIGPKMNFHAVDNGFLRLDNVRLPLDSLLARYSRVTPDGQYVRPPHDKLGYSTMIYVRMNIIKWAGDFLARAVTIAVRYSAVRRQFGSALGGGEQPVLDYPMQQYRLLTLLSASYAIFFTGKRIEEQYNGLVKALRSSGDLSSLPEVHATCSGLKAISTWLVSDGIEDCRKCCGGHGYSHCSGLPDLFTRFVPACTYEGDNVVLSLQTARYLLKCYHASKTSKPLPAGVAYLRPAPSTPATATAKTEADMLSPQQLLEAHAFRARALVGHCAVLVAQHVESDPSQNYGDALSACQVDLVKRMVKAHCHYTMVKCFVDAVYGGGLGLGVDTKVHRILKELCTLFALWQIEDNMVDFLEFSYFTPAHAAMVRSSVRLLLRMLRPDAVPLVDAFNFPDWFLNSSLGRYDGKVYEDMLAWAQSDPFNDSPLFDGYEEHIRPLLRNEVVQRKAKL